jgi:hypothetical protein
MFGWLKRRPNKVKIANFSIEMRTIFRECVDIIYEEHSHKFYFGGEKVGKKWRQVNLGVPTNLAPEDQSVLASKNWALSLSSFEPANLSRSPSTSSKLRARTFAKWDWSLRSHPINPP